MARHAIAWDQKPVKPQADGHSDQESRLRCIVETDFRSVNALRDEWDQCVVHLGSPVYMTFDWVKTWWEYYGKGKDLRLFLFWSDDALVGALPIYVETFGIGPWSARVARLVGANLPPKAFDPPIDPGKTDEILALVCTQLFMRDRCHLISLGPVCENWTPGGSLRSFAGARRRGEIQAVYRRHDVHITIDLPRTFETYMQSLRPSERKNRRRRLRQLTDVGRIESDVVSEPERLLKEFDSFADQHTEQWRHAGKPGHFRAWPLGREYNRALTARLAPLGRVRFYKLLCDRDVVANQYAYLCGDTLFCELPSRACGDKWDRIGLGGTAYLKLIEAAIEQGASRLDLGMGSYDNKERLGGEPVPVGTWRIVSGRISSRVKAACLLALAAMLRILYDKIWYRRILPGLPAWIGRTQSSFFLRFRI